MGRKYIDGILSQTGTPSANNDLTTKQYVDTKIASFKPFSYIVSSTASNTPQGIIWYNGTTQITGTLVASASTEYTIYLVPCKHTATETQKGYDEYLTVKNGDTYAWEVLGNTADIDLSEIADANIKTSQISNSRLFNNSLEGVINTGGSNYATIDGPKAEITNWSILNATFGDDADFESAEVTISDPTTKKNPVSLGYLETNYTTKTYVDGEVDTLFEEITNETDRAIKKENELSSSIDTLNKDLLQEIEDRENADSELKTKVSTIESFYIKKDGSVSMTGNLNLNSNKITNLKDPESDTDAVNKQFLNTSITTAQSSLETKINTEISNRQTEDSKLQSQIDAITSSSDVVDVVATKTDLNNYDKSKLTDKDIIKVLKDESQSDKTTYYRFDKSTSSFTLIGGVGPYYTQSEVDTKINQKQNTITSENKLAANLISGLSTVATTGSYNDLSDKPSESVVNNGKLTIQKNGTTIQTFTANQSTDTTVNVEVPTKTSELTNDSNYVTTTDLATKQDKITTTNKLSSSLVDGLSKVATSGSYNDLSNTPTIPTVNNGTLTIQKNGTTIQTFTANSSTNVNADITVPTKVSELSNDSGYTTNTGTVTSVAVKLNGTVKGTVTTSGTIDLGDIVDTNTTYSIEEGTGNTVKLTGSDGSTQTRTIDNVANATKASQDASGNVITETYATKNDIGTGILTIKTEGTSKGTFNANQTTNSEINITASDLGLSGAMKFLGISTTAITDGSTTNPITIDSKSVTAVAGNVVLYGSKEFVWTGSLWEELGDEGSHALKSITITGTGALSGGGSLEANRTITHNTTTRTNTTSTANPNYGETFTAIDSVESDSYGHISKVNTKTITMPSSITVDTTLSSTSTNPVQNKVINTALSGKVSKTGDTMTGTLVAPIIQTGTDTSNYFQSRKFRGEGDAATYYHAVDFGYAGHNQVDFYEHGGTFNFWENTTSTATSDASNRVASLQLGKLLERGNTLTYPGKSGTFALTSDILTKLSDLTTDANTVLKINEIDNINGNALVRYKSTEGKNVFGGVGYNAVIMGASTRPYYSSDGSDFTGVELALLSDLSSYMKKVADSALDMQGNAINGVLNVVTSGDTLNIKSTDSSQTFEIDVWNSGSSEVSEIKLSKKKGSTLKQLNLELANDNISVDVQTTDANKNTTYFDVIDIADDGSVDFITGAKCSVVPTNNNDLVNKEYVDNKIGNIDTLLTALDSGTGA